MTHILTVAIFALILAGCASELGYDKSAMRNATAAIRQATAICEKEQTASKFTACEVAAQRDFAVAIHLQKMDAFDAYATQMTALAADWEAGRVSLKQLGARAASIRNDYWFACNCDLRGRRTYAYNYPDIISSSMPTPW